MRRRVLAYDLGRLGTMWQCVLLALMLAATKAGTVNAQISPGPLARAHQSLEGATNCAQCHGLKREPMSQLCLACHKEIASLQRDARGFHGREAKASKKECAQCHPDHAGVNFALIEWPGGSATSFDHRKAGWPLEGKHAETKCSACHTRDFRTAPTATLSPRKSSAGWVGLLTECNACHRNDDVHRGSLTARCETCHTAKEWTSAPLFNHDDSKYPLTGAHVDVKCELCHATAKLPVVRNASGQRIGTFKPVPFKECSACHADPHASRLGLKCSSCHTTKSFSAVDKTGFDHQATRYPLRGRHLSVSCDDCHGTKMARPRPASATCGSCHKDVHGGEATLAGAAADCASCHSVSGFSPASLTLQQHAASKYPLTGKHRTTRCAACHTPAPNGAQTTRRVGRIRVPAQQCATCHADAHTNDTLRVSDGRCEMCHSTSSFAPSTFGAQEHAALGVTLSGRHGTIECSACHGASRKGLPPLRAPAERRAHFAFAIPERNCADCHIDVHNARFSKEPTRASCNTCHSIQSWRPSTVSASNHGMLGFKLEGAHRAVECTQCHSEIGVLKPISTLRLAPKGLSTLAFAPRTTTCASCHETPHGRQFEGRPGGASCDRCHSAETFSGTPAFDHNRSASFSLAGAHATVPCAQCHRAPARGAPIQYRPLSGKCESCHARGTHGGR